MKLSHPISTLLGSAETPTLLYKKRPKSAQTALTVQHLQHSRYYN